MGKRSNEYSAPAHKSSTIRGSYMSDESSGVEYGLNERKDFDSEKSSCFSINNEASVSENPRACIEPRVGYKVSSKGNSFSIGD